MKKILVCFVTVIVFLFVAPIVYKIDATCQNWQNNCPNPPGCSLPVNGTETCYGVDDVTENVCAISQTCNRADDRDSCDCSGPVGNFTYNLVSCAAGAQCIGTLGPNGSGTTCHYCATPICNDNGFQDGDETGVDCGGSVCPACTVTPTPTPTPTPPSAVTPPTGGGACNESCGTCGRCLSTDGSGSCTACTTDFGCCHREWSACDQTTGKRVCYTVFGSGSNSCSEPDEEDCAPSITTTPTPTVPSCSPPIPSFSTLPVCDPDGTIRAASILRAADEGVSYDISEFNPLTGTTGPRLCYYYGDRGNSVINDYLGVGCGTLNVSDFVRSAQAKPYANDVTANPFTSGQVRRGYYRAEVWLFGGLRGGIASSVCNYYNITCEGKPLGSWNSPAYRQGAWDDTGRPSCQAQANGNYVDPSSVLYSCNAEGRITFRFNGRRDAGWSGTTNVEIRAVYGQANNAPNYQGDLLCRSNSADPNNRGCSMSPSYTMSNDTSFTYNLNTRTSIFKGTPGKVYKVRLNHITCNRTASPHTDAYVTCPTPPPISTPTPTPTPTQTPTPTPALFTVTANVRDDIARSGCLFGSAPVTGAKITLNGITQPTLASGSRTFINVPVRNNNILTMSLLGLALYQNHRILGKTISPSVSSISILGGYSFATGPSRVINYCITNIQPWFQTTSGDVKMPRVAIPVPLGQVASAPQAGNDASIFISSLGVGTFLPGVASGPSWRWVANQEYTYSADSSTKVGSLSYSFFNSLPALRGVVIHDLLTSPAASCTGVSPNYTCDINFNNPDPSVVPGIYKVNGNLTIRSYQHRNGFQIVLMASDTIIILNPSGGTTIVVPRAVNNSLIVAAKNDLIFHQSVGSTDSTNTEEHAQGVFTAERDIVAKGGGCPDLSTGSTPDRRLNVGGALIANAANPFAAPGFGGLGNGRFKNERSLCASDSTYPSVKVITRPDFILNLNIDITEKNRSWKEVKP